MKRIMMGAAMFLLACTIAVSQVSLLNEATNGLFKNVNDFVIKPNVMFNTVETKQVIIGGGFNDLSFKSNTNGGGLIGYYHPGKKVHWSVATALDMKSSTHTVKEVQGTTETKYKNPIFNDYKAGIRFTIGLPSMMNLSAGLVAHVEGTDTNGAEFTSTTAGTETTTINAHKKTFDVITGIPVGFEITSSIYNFVEPLFFFSQDTIVLEGGSEEKTTALEYLVYDKLTFKNLFSTPFDSEAALWIGIGNANISLVDELKKPAYTIDSQEVGYEVKFSSQLGVSYLMDFSMGEVNFLIKPMVYADLLLGVHKSITFGTTIAADAGIYAPLDNLPIALFFAMTPGVQFYNTNNYSTEGADTITTTKQVSRAFGTSVFWNGKIGTSILLPKDMTLDITLNVNPSGKTVGLSALMSVSL